MTEKCSVPYREGSCFLVPLRTDGYARGVVARLDGDGRVFGYFFGPRILASEDATIADLQPDHAVLVGMFGDLGIMKGAWPVVGHVPGWNRADWPMPPLFRADESTGEAWVSHYDEETLDFVRERSAGSDERDRFPYDRLMGYGSVEIRLTKLLDAC